MDPEALELRLRDRLGGQVEARLEEMEREFPGLFDRATLLLMLADEEGLMPVQATLDVASEPPQALEVEGVVERLTPTRPFRRGDGTTGFVADLDVRTASGVQRVVLWDEAVRHAQGTQGRAVRVTALLEKSKGVARELHSTRATAIVRG